MTKSSVLRFSKYGVFQERSIYRRKIREKRGVFIERKSIANSEKARKCWAFEAIPSGAYESSFVVNGGGERLKIKRVSVFSALKSSAYFSVF